MFHWTNHLTAFRPNPLAISVVLAYLLGAYHCVTLASAQSANQAEAAGTGSQMQGTQLQRTRNAAPVLVPVANDKQPSIKWQVRTVDGTAVQALAPEYHFEFTGRMAEQIEFVPSLDDAKPRFSLIPNTWDSSAIGLIPTKWEQHRAILVGGRSFSLATPNAPRKRK